MHVHDVLIIGAGPCGLAVAARLHEHTPSATFTDDEHQRYHWIRKHGRKMNIKNYRRNTDSLTRSSINRADSDCEHDSKKKVDNIDMLILDADGAQWMSKWDRLFKTFGIEHLRSPMFFHIDAADRDGLIGYTYERNREDELIALPGCVGKEVSKHKRKKKLSGGRRLGISQSGPDVDERERKDYFVPSRELFKSHCVEVARKYSLEKDVIRQEMVIDIEYDDLGTFTDVEEDRISIGDGLDIDSKIFRVTTSVGVHYAQVVVLAIGPGNAPKVPPIPGLTSNAIHDGYCHAMRLKTFPPPHVASKISRRIPSNLLIVGGGLTSVQLADLALKRGVSKIWLLMRGGVKVKYFDMDLDWVGKFRNVNQAAFWSADTDEERFDMINRARNGGSMPPRYRKILDAHIASGKISLHTNTMLKTVKWDADRQSWTVSTTIPNLNLPLVDYIIFATGIQSDISTIPFLQRFQRQYPIEYVGGLPCLNDDLMWTDDVPLFLTGRLAALRLGPGAPNLVGARVGAERIAWNVEELIRQISRRRGSTTFRDEHGDTDDEKLAAYASGRRNRFDSLVEGLTA